MVYTLPITHSCGAASRPVTNRRYNLDYSSMPDFGGSIDTAQVALKNNVLGTMPYKPKHVTLPIIIDDQIDNRTLALQSSQSPLESGSNLLFSQQDDNDQYLCYLTHDTLKYYKFPADRSFHVESWLNTCPNDLKYSRSLHEPAKGLYYSPSQPRYFLVNFHNSVSLYKLRRTKLLDRVQGRKSKKPFRRVASIDSNREEDDLFAEPFDHLRDSCLNNFMPEMVAIACDRNTDCQIRLYDIIRAKAIRTISWSGLEFTSLIQREPTDIEPETLTTIRPQPGHLQNTIYATNFKVGLFDSRSMTNASVLANTSKLSTTFSWERFHGMSPSMINPSQFYVISDFHLRLFDQRYLDTTLNQVSHMLKVSRPALITSSVGEVNGIAYEKVCLSDNSKMCLTSFHRHNTEPVVNMISAHPPYHTSKPSDCFLKIRGDLQQSPAETRFTNAKVTGIHIAEHDSTLTKDCDNELRPCFDILQLTQDGSVFSQRYFFDIEKNDNVVGPAYIGQSLHQGDPCPISTEMIDRISDKFSHVRIGELRLPKVSYSLSTILKCQIKQEPIDDEDQSQGVSSRTRFRSSQDSTVTALTMPVLKSELLKKLQEDWHLS